MFVVAALVKDPHQARGLIRALADAAFEREEIESPGGPVRRLTALGAPESDAHAFAEGIRRGGRVVAVRADDEMEAELAALIMGRHGAVNLGACTRGWRSQGWSGRITAPEDRAKLERYPYVFGEYPAGAGRIYRTASRASRREYHGPERRHYDRPYEGVNRRTL
jgi:hypothetical protein